MTTTAAERRAIANDVPPAIAATLHHCAVVTGLDYSLLLAVCEHESGFRNVWGHDVGKFREEGQVTAAGVTRYFEAGAQARPNGIGPMQITSPALQQEARAHGGLHLPAVTTGVGVRFLAGLIRSYGTHSGVRRYNGQGPAADGYARDVMHRAAHWHTELTR